MTRNSLIQTARVEVARKSPIRRRMSIEARNGAQVIGKVKSMTTPVGVEYHPSIDALTLEFHCDCADHEFRKRVCKHLQKLALLMIRGGELPAVFFERAGLKCCHRCGQTKALAPMVSDDGMCELGVFICCGCIVTLRAECKGLTRALSQQERLANEEIEPEWNMEDEPLLFNCRCGNVEVSDDGAPPWCGRCDAPMPSGDEIEGDEMSGDEDEDRSFYPDGEPFVGSQPMPPAPRSSRP